MKVLIACKFSGIVQDAFIQRHCKSNDFISEKFFNGMKNPVDLRVGRSAP